MTQTVTNIQIKKENLKKLRYKFYHDLDKLYHSFFDEVAESTIKEGDAANLTQNILKARQDSLKYFLKEEEIEEYEKTYQKVCKHFRSENFFYANSSCFKQSIG